MSTYVVTPKCWDVSELDHATKNRTPNQGLLAVPSTIYMAQEMGQCVGASAVLQRALSARFAKSKNTIRCSDTPQDLHNA